MQKFKYINYLISDLLVNKRIQKTNAGSLIGKPVKITEEVDNANWRGKGVVEGMEWTVRAKNPASIITAGMSAKIVDIQGVKLIVVQTADLAGGRIPEVPGIQGVV